MIRGALQRPGVRLKLSEATSNDVSDDSGNVPTVLDASARDAHGGSNTGPESEIRQMEGKAHHQDQRGDQ